MFAQNNWPFTPNRLSEIIDKDTLSVIEAGCCERLGWAMTIIDVDQRTNDAARVDSINLRQNFEGFCALLRDERRVRGGNDACEKCDKVAAQMCLKASTQLSFHTIRCHMGLLDATHAIQICGGTVAVVFTGQYRPPEGIEQIKKNVLNLGVRNYAHIELLDEMTQSELLSLAEKLPDPPQDLNDRLKREADHIQQIVEAEYQRFKNLWEQEFLDTLRSYNGFSEITHLEQLRHCAGEMLAQIKAFCRCKYVIFFGSIQEGDTVLVPIAEVGLLSTIKKNLPHFNWKKAGLPLDNSNTNGWGCATGYKAAIKGIRGDNSHHFMSASCVLPATLGNRYRGVLVFGPFEEPVDLQIEQRFLMEVTNTIGSQVLTELEVLYLQQERRRWESTAKLLIHQLRTSLTPIATQVASARLSMQTSNHNTIKEVIDSLIRVEESCLRLGKTAKETVEAHVLLLEPEDLEFEWYPLSVLVANCVDGFVLEAEKRHRQLMIDSSVELLPEAVIDVARLTIALSNILENALKYSYPNTKINVRATVEAVGDSELATAIIIIDDLGDAIQLEDQERIFEQGVRGLTGAKLGRIPGSGLGLWEARAVIEAHCGTIRVSSEPTPIYRPQGQAHHVIFSVRIPLRGPGWRKGNAHVG